MTDTEMRIAIAEACGLSTKKENFGGILCYRDNQGHMVATLPDYPNDLNAMHEAEKLLETGHDGSQADDYQQALWYIVNPGIPFSKKDDVSYLQKLISATAQQRAEAFCKVIP